MASLPLCNNYAIVISLIFIMSDALYSYTVAEDMPFLEIMAEIWQLLSHEDKRQSNL